MFSRVASICSGDELGTVKNRTSEVVNNKIHKRWMDLIAIKTRGSHLNSICDGNVGDGMFL